MSISDLLTLLGIILAIIAFISEKNRAFVFLKFSNIDKGLIFFLIFFIHYLLSYQWLLSKFPILSNLYCSWLPTSSIWAYIFSILTVVWAIYKIFWAKFPISNRKKLMDYYDNLIKRNDMIFLSELIVKYHLEDIQQYIRLQGKINDIGNDTYSARYRKLNKRLQKSKYTYANNVFFHIVLNEKFIESVADDYPYLFSDIIKCIDKKSLRQSEFVNYYLKVLSIKKNKSFFHEIRNNNNYAEYNSYRIEKERPILYSLFWKIKVAEVNEVWKGIGEQAISELRMEIRSEFSELREKGFQNEEDILWSFAITNAISFFDIMLRRAIVKNINHHMWMSYYNDFVRLLLDNMPPFDEENPSINFESRNFDLIKNIFSLMLDWKETSIKFKKYQLINSIYSCIGLCIFKVGSTNKLSLEDKNEIFDLVWSDLIETSTIHNEEYDYVEANVVSEGIKMFANPTTMLNLRSRDENTLSYIECVNYMWENRDVAVEDGLEDRIQRFTVEVINPLNVYF